MSLVVLAAVLVLTPVYGQSVADVARETRAQKQQGAKTEGKPRKVFTNDDIPGSSSAAPAPTEAQKPAGTAGGTEPQPPKAAQPSAKPAEKSTPELEKEYREKFARLRESLATEEKKLDVMQRELNLMQVQFYSDPNVALREQNTRTEINTRTQEIVEQKAVVEKANANIAALEEELRRKGLPAGWAR